MKKSIFKPAAGIVLTLALSTSMLAACGSDSNSEDVASTSQPAQSAKKDPVRLTILAPLFNQQPPKGEADNPTLQKIQELTNTKLDVTWVPNANYVDKLNVNIASGDLPMITVITDMKTPSFLNAARASQFWEVGPYLKDYPNIEKAIDPIVMTNTSIDGKMYGIPRTRNVARVGLTIRQDWLDSLGLKMPQTMDEIYTVAKAFTEKDPDKNGKNDTYGIGLGSDRFWNGLDFFSVANGGFNQWGIKDGKVTPDFMTPAFDDALKLFRKLMQDKLAHPDYGSPGYDAGKLYTTGKIGMFVSAIDSDDTNVKLKNAFPNANTGYIGVFSGTEGQKGPANNGHAGVLAFPKSSVKTEADLKNILSFYNRTLEKDIYDLIMIGPEGFYTKKDTNGQLSWNDSVTQQNFSNDAGPFQQFLTWSPTSNSPLATDYRKKINEYLSSITKDLIANVAEPFISQTWSEKGGELNKIITDAITKYVVGGNWDEYKKAIDTWQQRGGSKVIEEYTAAYNALKK